MGVHSVCSGHHHNFFVLLSWRFETRKREPLLQIYQPVAKIRSHPYFF